MLRYVLRRFAELVPVLFLASIFIWALIYAVPGNPVVATAGLDASPEQIANAMARLGLDRPLHEQYLKWLGNILRFDLGVSAANGLPILDQILTRLPATVQLATMTIAIAILIGVPLGLVSALAPGSVADRVIAAYQALTLALPTFWVGMLLILLFSIQTHLLPSISSYYPFFDDPWRAFTNTLMPALSMALYFSSVLSRFVASSVSIVLEMDYILFARSKGVPEKNVIVRHALHNSAIPVITVLGLQLGGLLGGSIVIEVVFNYPGIGRMLYAAVSVRDYPVVQVTVLLAVVGFLLVNFIVDILYAAADPRVRL